jgi:hypothetical protein
MVPLKQTTFGQRNADVAVGPLVVSEFNYNPGQPSDAALVIVNNLNSSDLEFIEITNPTGGVVSLDEWRVRGEVDFDFPVGVSLTPGQSVTIVSFDVAAPANASRLLAFRAHYTLPADVQLLGGFSGALSNSYGVIRLERPGPTLNGDVPRLLADEFVYDDRSPWPDADGNGLSLTRRSVANFAGDGAGWQASSPTPGSQSTVNADLNGDGIVNVIDVDILSSAIRLQNAPIDLDGDGATTKSDLDVMITQVLQTSYGDANLDGTFNLTDLVLLFTAGEYEDGIPFNSTWAEGDWNADGDFTTRDLVEAFMAGGYVPAATRADDIAAARSQSNETSQQQIAHDRQLEDSESVNNDLPRRKRELNLNRVPDRSLTVRDHLFADEQQLEFTLQRASDLTRKPAAK